MKIRVFLLALIVVFTSHVSVGNQPDECSLKISHIEASNGSDPMVTFLKEYLDIKYNGARFEKFIYVAAKRQKLYLIYNDTIVKTYTISTAAKGIGNLSGSYKTPEGLHKIAEKVGDELPINSVIKSKIATGEKVNPILEAKSNNRDLITTRVLHLKGLEKNVNTGKDKDSYSRGIFIHGTHEEGLLGMAASKGCVRMSNKDVIELFDSVEVGTFVIILNN